MKKRLKQKFSILLVVTLCMLGFPTMEQRAYAEEIAGETMVECESMSPITHEGGVINAARYTDSAASGGGFWFLQSNGTIGHWVQLTATLPRAGAYDIYVTTKDNRDRGIYTVTSGEQIIGQVDGYYNAVGGIYVEHYIGRMEVDTQTVQIKFSSVGKQEEATNNYGLALDYMRLVPVEETILECESMSPITHEGGVINAARYTDSAASGGGFWFLQSTGTTGHWVQLTATLDVTGVYDLYITTKDNKDRGIFSVTMGDYEIGEVDGYYNASGGIYREHYIGRINAASTSVPLKFTAIGQSSGATGRYGLAMDTIRLVPISASTEGEVNYFEVTDTEYTELSGTWFNSSLEGYEGSASRYSNATGSTAAFSTYPPNVALGVTKNFNVYAWIPAGANVAMMQYTIETANGTWVKTIDNSVDGGTFAKLATVTATGETAFTVTLSVISGTGYTYASTIMLEKTTLPADAVVTPGGGDETSEAYVFANQTGYNTVGSKRATVVNVADQTAFYVKHANTNMVAYSGYVNGGIADFSDFEPVTYGEFYVECSGAVSYTFSIGKYWIQRVSVEPTLAFMSESRSDTFEAGRAGIGWRDSHQFSFELNSLVLQYMANPVLYERLPYGIYKANTCEYEELRVQNEPDIVWLMKFAALRYYDLGTSGYHLHMLTKEQLAYFLYIYPEISDYVSDDLYETIRDFAINIWTDSTCNLQYYQVSGENNNLLATQTVIGSIKGSNPPGHSIIPNLMMYEVIKRDGLGTGMEYFNAAYNTCQWLLDNIDITDPQYSGGQRMSEHIVMESLAYFQEMYPQTAPANLASEIARWANVMLARSNNMWDLRMAASTAAGDVADYWTGAGWAYANEKVSSIMNEPGNVAGIQAITYAASRVLTDTAVINRLKEIGDSAIDDMFGRNPYGRTFFYNYSDIEGADFGWFTKYQGGNGVLGNVTGRIDGSPKEAAYEFNPNADKGYTEGWVAYNSAWNASLAYEAADKLEIATSQSSISRGDQVTVTLTAPLNLDYNVVEYGFVNVKDASTGEVNQLTVTEASADAHDFIGTITAPSYATTLEVTYGYGLFQVTTNITVR